MNRLKSAALSKPVTESNRAPCFRSAGWRYEACLLLDQIFDGALDWWSKPTV